MDLVLLILRRGNERPPPGPRNKLALVHQDPERLRYRGTADTVGRAEVRDRRQCLTWPPFASADPAPQIGGHTLTWQLVVPWHMAMIP